MTRATRERSAYLTLVLAAVLLAGAFTLPSFGDGGDRDARIVPIGSLVEGRGYDEWSAAWWQWVSAFAPDVNPVADGTGAAAASGQSGQVFFLAGTFGGTVVRNVTIPRGVNIFFPVVNSEWDTAPGFTNPLDLPDPLSVHDIRKIVAFFVNDSSLACEIDGVRVRNLSDYRVKSPVFSMNQNPDFAQSSGYPTPYVRTAVSDGCWLMLAPLSVGHHVIHFKVSNAKTGFALDVTYNITIMP